MAVSVVDGVCIFVPQKHSKGQVLTDDEIRRSGISEKYCTEGFLHDLEAGLKFLKVMFVGKPFWKYE